MPDPLLYYRAQKGYCSLSLVESNRVSLWRKRASRLGQVRWDELHTRLTQAVNKRIDLVHYYAGLRRHAPLRNEEAQGQGRFFFFADDVQPRAHLLRKHLSREVERIIQEADEICCHRFRLLGYAGLDYGAEVDWHLDAVHGIRAPLRVAHKIPYLDYSVVGDHKVIWELNRHQHLVTLAKAWVLTHEEKYAAELIRHWYSWQDANPYPLGINWVSALEVAFRSLSWLWVRFLLAGCSAVPAAFEDHVVSALALNGSHIERYLSTYFSPNTHLLGELTALFFIGLLCPRISKAESWRSLGWNGLLRQAERQVRGDGVYFEQSLYYHVYALDFFLHARTLAVVNGMEVADSFDAVLQRMLVFLRTMTLAGPPQTFGDDDGGRVFSPRRNHCEQLGDPLVVGAILFEREDLATAPLTEEALWLFGERALETFNKGAARPQPSRRCFEAAGIYVVANAEPQAPQLVIDAGPMGAGRVGHGHADALSVTLSFDQRPWLVDPGTFVYVPGSTRDRFRGTEAHNTWTVDGSDQAEARGLFAWGAIPEVRREQWITGETFTLFVGSHNGYFRLSDPVLHRRSVFHLRGRFWLVRDLFQGRGVHHCTGAWHFASDLKVQEVQGTFVATPVGARDVCSSRLAMTLVPDPVWVCELAPGETSPVYGVSEAAPVLRINGIVQLPVACAVMIIPLFSRDDKPGSFSRMPETKSRGSDEAIGFLYTEQRRSHSIIFSNSQGNWQLGPWMSDANFLYCCMRDDELEHLVLCGGSFARLAGKAVFTHGENVGWVEWLAQNQAPRVFSSDKSAALGFSQMLLRSYDPALH